MPVEVTLLLKGIPVSVWQEIATALRLKGIKVFGETYDPSGMMVTGVVVEGGNDIDALREVLDRIHSPDTP